MATRFTSEGQKAIQEALKNKPAREAKIVTVPKGTIEQKPSPFRDGTPFPQPTIKEEDCEAISRLEYDQYPAGVVVFKDTMNPENDSRFDCETYIDYIDNFSQFSNCGLTYQQNEDGSDRWCEDFEGNRHPIESLDEQCKRLGGIGEGQNEPVMEGTPPEVAHFFNACEDTIYKSIIKYIDLYPMVLNTLWWKHRGHVLRYHTGSRLGLHNDNDTNFRVVDGIRYKSEREIALYVTVNGLLCLGDDYEGGEIGFPYSNMEVKLQKGDLVIFPTNFIASHEVNKITEGTRYTYLVQYGHGEMPGHEIQEAPLSYDWLPPVYIPWIYQDYERFFNSPFSTSLNGVSNPISQERAIEGPPEGMHQPWS